MLKKSVSGKNLLGSINVLPECDVGVCLDISTLSLDCTRPLDTGSAVVLAKSLFDGGFKETSIKYVQSLRTVSFTNNEVLLQISD